MRHALQQVASLIACLTLSFAVLTTSAVAQGRDEPPIEQIKLTEAQVVHFIAAQPDLARLAGKMPVETLPTSRQSSMRSPRSMALPTSASWMRWRPTFPS